jgi:hypothetical protein
MQPESPGPGSARSGLPEPGVSGLGDGVQSDAALRVESTVGDREQRLKGFAVGWIGCGADREIPRHVAPDRVSSGRDLCVESGLYGGGALRRLLGEEERELIAAEPADYVAGAGAVAQETGDLLDQLIADQVSIAVVDRLESADVQVGERERPAVPAGPSELPFDGLAEPAPVQKAGERVGRGSVLSRGDRVGLAASATVGAESRCARRCGERERREQGEPDCSGYHADQLLDRPGQCHRG